MPLVDQQVTFRPLEAIFDAYLSAAPLAHALFRTAEAEHLSQVSLHRPVLDLGCGCGQLAAAALEGVIDAGVDIAARQLAKARRTGRYRECHLVDARALPFEDGKFQTVLSVSVLEHIREPEAVLAEVFRVLAPGGTFVATVVLPDLHQNLFYPALLRRLRLPWLGCLYARLHDAAFRHHHLAGKEEWEERLAEAGFQVALSKKVVPPGLTRWWDVLLLTAWPHLLLRRLGLPGMWRPRWLRALAGRLCRRLRREQGEEGSVLFFVARKNAEVRGLETPTWPEPSVVAEAVLVP